MQTGKKKDKFVLLLLYTCLTFSDKLYLIKIIYL